MNVTLSINTNETGERFKFFCLSQAEEMYYSLSDIRDNLDNISKYSTFLHLFMGKESLLRLYKEEKKQFPFENLSNEQLSELCKIINRQVNEALDTVQAMVKEVLSDNAVDLDLDE